MSFRSDIKKYKRYTTKSTLVLVLTQQGLWALFVYRIFNKVYRSKTPQLLKRLILIIGVIFQKWIEIVAGISLPYSVSLGKSCYIGHFGNVIFNANAIVGNDCNISQGVTIGVSGTDENRGVPIIGNHVYIGANAVIAGKLKVGDDVLVGANSLVVSDVPNHCTILGVPAEVISETSSKAYIG